jgi:NADPH2:quinone reductase
MDAAVLTQADAPPALGTFEEPVAGDGQLVIEVAVAGLNPADLATAAGAFGTPPALPRVPGLEGAGHVDGRPVYFGGAVPPFGSMAQRALALPDEVFERPEELDEGVAVALGVAGLAAWLPLTERAGLQPGETVLVLGATGVLGTIAVQAAKILGAGRVIAAGRDAEGLERASRRGADAVVDLSLTGDPTEAYLEASGGGGVDVTIDTVWGEPALAALKAIARFGRHVQIGNSASAEMTLPSRAFRAKTGTIMGYTNFNVPAAERRRAYAEMTAHAAAGRIEVDIERVALRDVPDAWQRQGDSVHHKLVLVP